jgi:ribonuclease HII
MSDTVIIVGIDEVGRGCLSGDCWAAAVAFPGEIPAGLKDSKATTLLQRTRLAGEIRRLGFVGVGRATVEEIDRFNILRATMLAMKRAFDALPAGSYQVLVDGNKAPELDAHAVEAVIGGDALHAQISAASIIAKVERDAHMDQLHQAFPHYEWDQNKGYGTEAHLEAIRLHGISPHHRKSFGPICQPSLPL